MQIDTTDLAVDVYIIQDLKNVKKKCRDGISAADRGGGNRGSLPWAPSVRGAPNSAGLVQIRSVRQSHSSLRGWFRCIFD